MRLFQAFLLFCPALASAGEHRELCDKVEAAAAVVELQFDQVAVWPPEHKEKSWAPPKRELVKTAKTGRVIHVFKGSVDVGDPWVEAWGTQFTISGMEDWKTFMALGEFQQIWFMDGEGGTTGWAEESAGCGSSDQDSWCEGYEHFKTQLRACLIDSSERQVVETQGAEDLPEAPEPSSAPASSEEPLAE